MSNRPFTVLALGDCNTCGVNGAAGQIVPDLVVAGLRGGGRDCQLVNLGLTMSTTREGLAKLKDYSSPVDLLLLNFGLVDAWTTSLPGLYVSYFPDYGLKIWARKILKTCKRRLRHPLIRKWLPVGQVVPRIEYESNIRMMIGLAQSQHPRIRILLWGTAPVRDDPTRNQMIERYNTTLKHIAESSPGVHYYDTTAAVKEYSPDQVLLDIVHLNAFAAGRVADGILSLLESKGA